MQTAKNRSYIAPVLMLIVVSLVLLTVVSAVTTYFSVYNEAVNTLRQKNSALVYKIDGWIRLKGNLAENCAELLRNPDMDFDAVISHFNTLIGREDGLIDIFVGFYGGGGISAAGAAVREGYIAAEVESDWYRMARSNPGRVVFPHPFYINTLNLMSFSSARTVHRENDSLGVVTVNVSFDAMTELFLLDDPIEGSYSFIMDANGTVLLQPDMDGFTADDCPFVHNAGNSGNRCPMMAEGILREGFYAADGALYVGVPLNTTGWYVVTYIPSSYIMDDVFLAIISIGATTLMAVISIIGIGIVMRKAANSIRSERESFELNEIFLNSSPYIFNIWDENINLIRTSQQSVEMFGLKDQKQYIEEFHLLSPEYQPCGTHSGVKAGAFVKRAFEEGGKVAFEWMHQKITGELMPTEITLVRFQRNGRYFVAAYTTDLRPIKDEMNKAIEAEKRAKLLLDTSPTSCFLLDEDFNAIDCNQAAVKLFIHQPDKSLSDFGFVKPDSTSCQWNCETCLHNRSITCISRKRLTKNAWKTFCIDDGKDMGAVKEWLSKQCRTALQDGANYFEHEHMTLYGERVPCAVTIVPVSYQNKTAFAYYLEDFREAAKMFAEIHKREVAEGESRAKTRFLARMSHEIRTPMNAVLGIAGFQLRKKGHPSDTEEAFTRIYNSSSLLLTIINDILDLSKVEAGKLEFVVEEYNVPNCILDTVQLNIMHVGTKKVEFKLAVDGSLPVTLLGDELRIKQILNNLLSNAFKYTKEGTVLLTFGFEETVDPGEIFLVMKVSDTGQGMTNEQIDKLFDIEFTRFNIKTNRAIEGSGLGMSITRSLVEMMHGEITVESEPGAGTAFTVRLPQKIKDWQVIGDDEAQNLQNLQISQKTFKEVATPIYEAMPYGKVLAVDDVDTNLYVVRGILAPYKIAVETVSGGREAVEKIKDGNTYDIIFMDHMMPDVDGVEATKMIRELGYEEPIVALTANAFKDIEEMFMNNGFNGFISKPINIEQLHTYIVKFVRDKYPPEVREAAKALHRDEPTDIDKFFDFFEDD